MQQPLTASNLKITALSAIAIVFLLTMTATAGVAMSGSADDDRAFSVRCRLEVAGDLQTAAPDSKGVTLPMKADARLSFLERRLPAGGKDAEAFRSVRSYQVGEARIEVSGQPTENHLPADGRLIVAEGRSNGVRLWCPSQPMTFDSLDLLSTPGDSLALHALLPETEVEAGATWQPAFWVLPLLTGVEAVSKHELNCRLEKVDEKFAVIAVNGSVEGAIDGALTKIAVNGQVAWDLEKQHIRQAKITQTEERAVGVVSPGMKVTATMYVDRLPSSLGGPLSGSSVESIPIVPEAQQLALQFNSPWDFHFACDRNWHLFHQTNEVAVLRLVEKGSLIAQCNVSKVPQVAAGSHTPEQTFQNDIRTALAGQLQQMTKAEQLETTDGRWLYRVTATGMSNNRPMTWYYYLCAAPDGRQVAFAFSLETRFVEQFANRDLGFARSLTFGTRSGSTAARP
ncbi:hypothetical protein GC176_03640 [bacterium]|nr:hypothetical protein [bacterium]